MLAASGLAPRRSSATFVAISSTPKPSGPASRNISTICVPSMNSRAAMSVPWSIHTVNVCKNR